MLERIAACIHPFGELTAKMEFKQGVSWLTAHAVNHMDIWAGCVGRRQREFKTNQLKTEDRKGCGKKEGMKLELVFLIRVRMFAASTHALNM